MNYQEQKNKLVSSIIANLCSIDQYPEGMLPHTVFVEEENSMGEPVFNHYMLISINQKETTCILEDTAKKNQVKYSLTAIEFNWLIALCNWCQALMIESKTWRSHPTHNPIKSKSLFIFLYPISRFSCDASDAEIIADWENGQTHHTKTEKYTCTEYAAHCNTETIHEQTYWTRFIYC